MTAVANLDEPMQIEAIQCRTVLNSHAQPTTEFVVTLDNGISGRGSAPEGETLSRSEQMRAGTVRAERAAEFVLAKPGLRGAGDQAAVDRILREHRSELGSNTILGISVGYLDATSRARNQPPYALLREMAGREGPADPGLPILLLNVLNGGAFARTNPVLSDFPEYLLVPTSSHLEDYLAPFHELQNEVRRQLGRLNVVNNNGSPVHVSPGSDNRVWIEFLLEALERLGFTRDFELMIDASAGDLASNGVYRFARTDARVLQPDELVEYWMQICRDYPMAMIEDPFAEDAFDAWIHLHRGTQHTTVVGDNLCSTDATMIRRAAREEMINAVLIKPNQAGTVTDVVEAVGAALDNDVLPIPSHRSVETDVAWLADICFAFGVGYAKLGLLSDFETIEKVNRLIRYGESGREWVAA